MIDLPLMEQIDRLLWTVAIGMATVPIWYLVVRLSHRRGLWPGLREFFLLGALSLAAAAAVFLGTLGDLRAYVPIGFVMGGAVAGSLLKILHAPWQETRSRRRI